MQRILRDDLGLVKKSARWVPKLLNEDQKQERVRTCKEFIATVQRHSMAMLDCIGTMDETMVSYHTPETKKQSKQWLVAWEGVVRDITMEEFAVAFRRWLDHCNGCVEKS